MKDYNDFNDWQTSTLPEQTFAVLKKLHKISSLQNFYLVGGTALALYLGHRKSIDLDFFIDKEFSANIIEDFKPIVQNNLKVIHRNNGSVEFILDDVKIFLKSFYYPITRNKNEVAKIKIISPIDIALMKIIALEGRAAWKDIIDLYFIDQKVINIELLAKKFFEVYPKESFNEYSRLLVTLDAKELDKSPKPDMLVDIDFKQARDIVYEKLLKSFSNNIQIN